MTTSSGQTVSVLIPAFNEAATIGKVLDRVDALGVADEILVANDGSTDETAEIVQQASAANPAVRLLDLGVNRGKGAAIREAISQSTGQIVVIQDADLEYDPADLPRLLEPLESGVADVVYGTRLRGGSGAQRVHLFWHYVGNRLLSLLTNILYNTTISDMEVGYKLFDGDLIRSIRLVSDSFAFEPEVTAKLLRRNVRFYEVPISYYGRTYEEGKKIGWRDGVEAVAALLRFRFGPR